MNQQAFWDFKLLGHLIEFGLFSNIWVVQICGSTSWLM